jgi:hypothetical protein
VAHHQCPAKPGAHFFSTYAVAPSKRRRTPPSDASPSAWPPAPQDASTARDRARHGRCRAPKTRPGHRSADRSRSSTDASSPRRTVKPSAERHKTLARLGSRRRHHRVARKATGVGRQSHCGPRSVWPPTNPAEHHDHRSGVGADHALVVALRRRAVRSRRIGERRVGARAAIRVQRATEHHP